MRKQAAAKLRVQFAPVYSALGDTTRLALLATLGEDGEQSIQSLTLATSVTRQAVTKHLHVLQRAGLVRCREQGRERHFQLERARLDEAQQYLAAISQQWDDALLRLKAHVER